MKGENWKIVLTAVFFIAALWYLFPTVRFMAMSDEQKEQMADTDPAGLNELQSRAIKLGLDLQGGMHVVLEVDKSQLDENATKDATERALQIIRNRVDQFGVSEPNISQQGDNRIIVALPALHDIERARNLIGKTAMLEFKLVESPENSQVLFEKIDRIAATLADELTGESDTTEVTTADELSDQPTFEDPFADASDSSGDTTSASIFDQIDDEPIAAAFSQYLEFINPQFQVLDEDFYEIKRILEHPEIQAIIPGNLELAWGTRTRMLGGRKIHDLYVLKKQVEVSGNDLTDARPNYDQYHKPIVDFTLTREGGRKLSRVSGPNIGKPLAIVLDGRVESAPVIKSKLRDKATITLGGGATYFEAKDLSTILRAGALPAPVRIVENNVIGPTLGRDSIEAGKRAIAVALILVLIFMLIYYKISGIIAACLVVLNMTFLLAFMSGLHATLTLPGIAGIVLILGITVDASVLIFERIREELRTGKTTKAAIQAGYDRATIAIVDSNITTLIAAGVLYYFGTGPIKGFATTLGIGIIISLYTALVVGKTIFSFRRRATRLSI